MRVRSGSIGWLGPLVCSAVLAGAVATPATAQAAVVKKSKKSKKSNKDEKTDDAEAESSEAADEDDDDDDGGGEASASVSTSGVAAGASKGGKKGAPMKGRFGLGAIRTVSGLNALYGRYYLANRFTLGLVAGFATFSHRETDDNGEFDRTRTVGAVAIGPELFFWPVQGPRDQQVHADFGIGARVNTYIGFLGIPREERSNTLDTPVEVDLEIPAKIQLFVGRRVSINPEFGIAVRFIPGSREADQNGDSDQNPGTGIGSRLGTTDGPGLGFELGNHAGFFMGIGVGYYFGKLRS